MILLDVARKLSRFCKMACKSKEVGPCRFRHSIWI